MNNLILTGLDEIPARFLKDSASFMKIPVTVIVNMSENYLNI